MTRELLYLLLIAAGIVLLAYFFLRRRSAGSSPLSKPCSVCDVPARYGYSPQAEEEIKNIQPMCLGCLITQLMKDYKKFDGKAVVVQPVNGPPVYVYQPLEEWEKAFPSSRIAGDVDRLLKDLEKQCQLCGVDAKYLWIESSGLSGENFSDTLDNGISKTLLRQNPAPKTLCAECCVRRIKKELQKDIDFLEVCAPRGSTKGFVMPMGY